MHISLEEFNLMLRQDISDQERARLTDHILECDMCATRFRALNDLAQQMDEAPATIKTTGAKIISMPLVRYGMGVAAVMAMAIIPYLKNDDPQNMQQRAIAAIEDVNGIENEKMFSILDEVRRVNYQTALEKWGQETNMVDLINASK